MTISPSDSPTTRQVDTIHRQRITPTLVNERIVRAIREAKMAVPASSILKRSRTLPNCSREDRIRDGSFKRRG